MSSGCPGESVSKVLLNYAEAPDIFEIPAKNQMPIILRGKNGYAYMLRTIKTNNREMYSVSSKETKAKIRSMCEMHTALKREAK